MALHRNLGVTDGIHIPYAWEYADDTARTTASGMIVTDVGKFSRQVDEDSIWMLVNHSPVTWQAIGGGEIVPFHASSHLSSGDDSISIATPSIAGLMSSSDKSLLDSLGAGNVVMAVRNETGSSIVKGMLVAPVGYSIVESRVLVQLADKDTVSKRPALGVTSSQIDNNSNGEVVVVGLLEGVNTSSWDVTDQLVLGVSGSLLRPPPETDPFTGEIQNIGSVVTSHTSTGQIAVSVDGLNAFTADYFFASSGTNGSPGPLNPYVTDSDPRLTNPEKSFRVSPSGGDYTSIKSAIDAAIADGASSLDPYHIKIYPGLYNEDPMSLPQGVVVEATVAQRLDTVLINANDNAEDLFTSTGGSLTGVELQGVTDVSKALIRAATPGTLTVLHGVAFKGCSTGLAVSSGAKCVGTVISVNIDTPGVGVTTAISVDGAGSYFGSVGGFLSAPSALLPFYANNPIQTGVKVTNSAEAFLSSFSVRIAGKDTTQDGLLVESGGTLTVLSSEVSECYRASRIGSSGSGSKFIIQGCAYFNNTINGQCDSDTGVFLVSAATDDFKWASVPGAIFSGLVQSIDYNRSFLAGDLSYWYPTGKATDVGGWVHHKTSTGVMHPESDTTLVTLSGGLYVNVAAGAGLVTRPDDHDVFDVSWSSDTIAVSSGTNYVVYNYSSSSVEALSSPPGEELVLLGTVYSDDLDVRFIHNTNNIVEDEGHRLHNYLLKTRKIVHNTGAVTNSGTTTRKIDITPGSYYRALSTLTVSGTGGDATFSYFYGLGGESEVPGQTDLDITQYDNTGVLTSMTSNYYRSDTIVVTSDQRISVLYGTEEFENQEDAESASLPTLPVFISDTGMTLARAIVKEGSGAVLFIDARPVANAAAVTGGGSGGGGASDHGDLTGLVDDDHTQYMLADGTRSFTGVLNVGGNHIINVGNVDGVDVSDHSGRHTPGQLDSLSLGTPVQVQVGGASDGTANTYVRSDHQHGLETGTPGSVGTGNSEGSSSSVARLDHIHSGLTRGSSDFSSFSEKTSVHVDDLVLIEDSESSNVKKKTKISNILSAAEKDDLACVSARRTTSFTGSSSWSNVTFNATDVENDTSIVEHSDTNTDRIIVKETGLYQIGFFTTVLPTGFPSTIEGRIRKNGSTVIPNSYVFVDEDHEDANLSGISMVELTAEDYVSLQLQVSVGTETVRQDITFFVVRMSGRKGDKGDSGSGSSINLKDEGSSVSGGPHDTIDFVGTGLDVSNSGAGEAQVRMVLHEGFQYATRDSSLSTSSTSFQQYLRLTTGTLAAGIYRIGWNYTWRHSSASYDIRVRVQVDDTTTLLAHREEPKDSGSNQRRLNGAFKYIVLGAGSHTIDMDFCRGGTSGTSYMYTGQIEIWRVE